MSSITNRYICTECDFDMSANKSLPDNFPINNELLVKKQIKRLVLSYANDDVSLEHMLLGHPVKMSYVVSGKL